MCKKSKIKLLEISIAIAFVISTILSVVSFGETCGEIRGDVLRLHVLANSDDEKDQQLKLKVRDEVLKEGKEIFDGSINIENVKERVEPQTARLEKAAKKVIVENGYDYNVAVKVTDEYFSTRTYENVTLPAGFYRAVKVEIGTAEGRNWWCVMFPPLCLPAAENKTQVDIYMTDDEAKVVSSNPKYDPRFKIIEIYEKLKSRFVNK